ncbi:MAG: Hsp20/alpha crystallin family protein [Cyanobacteria bacterium P01_G01_bin.54]
MAILHWQPFSEIDTLRRQMERLFEDVSDPTAQTGISFQPAIELKDTENTLVLKAQLPGINPDDFEITVTREHVTLQGERKYEKNTESEGLYRSEFRYGQLKRVIGLPVAVQQDKVEADYTHGVLTLNLPKVIDQAKKAVKINLGNPQLTDHPVADQG